jgi:hypothetical protein
VKKWWMWMAAVAAALSITVATSCTEEQNKATTACLTSIVPQASVCIAACAVLPPKECAGTCAEKIIVGAAPVCAQAYGDLKSAEFGAAVAVVTQGLVDVYYALRVDLATKSAAMCAPCPVCAPSDDVPSTPVPDALKAPSTSLVVAPIPDPSPK